MRNSCTQGGAAFSSGACSNTSQMQNDERFTTSQIHLDRQNDSKPANPQSAHTGPRWDQHNLTPLQTTEGQSIPTFGSQGDAFSCTGVPRPSANAQPLPPYTSLLSWERGFLTIEVSPWMYLGFKRKLDLQFRCPHRHFVPSPTHLCQTLSQQKEFLLESKPDMARFLTVDLGRGQLSFAKPKTHETVLVSINFHPYKECAYCSKPGICVIMLQGNPCTRPLTTQHTYHSKTLERPVFKLGPLQIGICVATFAGLITSLQRFQCLVPFLVQTTAQGDLAHKKTPPPRTTIGP